MKTEKPRSTKISIIKEKEGYQIIFPAGGFSLYNIFLFGISAFNLVTAFFFYNTKHLIVPTLFVLAFGFLLFAGFIINTFFHSRLSLNSRQVTYRTHLFKRTTAIIRDYQNLHDIKLISRVSPRGHHLILCFRSSANIHLPGSTLEKEQLWLKDELYKVKIELDAACVNRQQIRQIIL